jgi:methylmalonyl-CoA mutase
VFLATPGTPADFTARMTFARSLFEAGGIEASVHEGADTDEALAAAFRASGAQLVCLCSSDKVYGTHAIPAVAALRRVGAPHIYLAGKPGNAEAAYRSAGIGEFVFAGCDALATLQAAYDKLERPQDQP